MPSAGRSNFVRVLPWVVCLALGAAAHLLWALHAWWGPPAVVVQIGAPQGSVPAAIVVTDPVVSVRRTESDAASDPKLVAMLVDAYVRCDSEDSCTVDPRLVDTMLADPSRLTRQARLVPEQQDGRAIGLKLFAIRPDTVLHALGLRSGDVLVRVGDVELGRISDHVGFSTLRPPRDGAIEVAYERRGEPRTLKVWLKRFPVPR